MRVDTSYFQIACNQAGNWYVVTPKGRRYDDFNNADLAIQFVASLLGERAYRIIDGRINGNGEVQVRVDGEWTDKP